MHAICNSAQRGHWFGPVTRLGLLGSAQPHGPSWTQPKKKTSNIVGFLMYLVYYFFILWKYKSSIKIPGFSMKCCKYIYMSEKQKIFSCVLHTANTLTCFECFFLGWVRLDPCGWAEPSRPSRVTGPNQ